MTDKELKKFASTKSKPLPHYVEDGKPYAEKPTNESNSFGPDLLDDGTQHYEVGDRFLVVNTSKFPDWYGGFRGYENLKVGDVVQVRERSRELTIVLDSLQKKERDIPSYLDLKDDEKSIKLISRPLFSEVPYPVEMQPHLITEFYSR
jgi:hypothetical protein